MRFLRAAQEHRSALFFFTWIRLHGSRVASPAQHRGRTTEP
ncbi:MAG: hypothetical protein AVDCRST_MAG19-5001 [uncultured Thermomicrobiales bacterium]|uniref:Uncharacterized protein n=1 Tax=uncultured Thermomicrobiales bacterium TaxID=1645740 RepID=A0A6J4VT50_9BACT|nr:MAG: hypothetical protein AVDCRST_MAG19-5001 [uncultured Thermomicrobiales bacterium]